MPLRRGLIGLFSTIGTHGFGLLGARDIGAWRIGHFGFFRREFCDSLWRAHLLPELDTGPA